MIWRSFTLRNHLFEFKEALHCCAVESDNCLGYTMAGLKKSPRTRWVLMSFDMSEDCATEDERTDTDAAHRHNREV
ncbi:hypothetical protein H9L39_11757 [Fusarium oxysporum f. sp. albedinis]|nr:hypothetical protein H9L39_11757 [Fusarium oxysporum f. sp. albedinis]